jgi:hypothetical protein
MGVAMLFNYRGVNSASVTSMPLVDPAAELNTRNFGSPVAHATIFNAPKVPYRKIAAPKMARGLSPSNG